MRNGGIVGTFIILLLYEIFIYTTPFNLCALYLLIELMLPIAFSIQAGTSQLDEPSHPGLNRPKTKVIKAEKVSVCVVD